VRRRIHEWYMAMRRRIHAWHRTLATSDDLCEEEDTRMVYGREEEDTCMP
jgi:hypothetical protein